MVWDAQNRDLEEVRDMLLLSRGEQEKKLTMTRMDQRYDANPVHMSMMGTNME